MNSSTQMYMEGAERLGLKTSMDPSGKVLCISNGNQNLYINGCRLSVNNDVAVRSAGDKVITNKLFRAHDLPVPDFLVVKRKQQEGMVTEIQEFYNMHKNIVIKPSRGLGGEGITILPEGESGISAAIDLAFGYSSEIMLEKYIPGKHFRILMVGDTFISATERVRGRVSGNGQDTIRELISKKSLAMYGKSDYFKFDEIAEYLAQQGVSLADTLEAGHELQLHEKVSMKYGATFNDVSTEIHSSIIESCRKAMKLIGLRYAGFDYISGDISSPDGCFNEVNSMPSIKLSYSYASSDVVIKVIQEAIKIA